MSIKRDKQFSGKNSQHGVIPGEALKATECSEEDRKTGGTSEKSMKVPMVVRKERYDVDGSSNDFIDLENPKCVLPEHYFDALVHRRSTSSDGEDVRQLLSIETWDGRKIVSWDTPD